MTPSGFNGDAATSAGVRAGLVATPGTAKWVPLCAGCTLSAPQDFTFPVAAAAPLWSFIPIFQTGTDLIGVDANGHWTGGIF